MPGRAERSAEALAPGCGGGKAGDAGPAASVLVAQLGARRHYAVPRALWRAGLLDRLVTDFCSDVGPWPVLRSAMAGVARPAGLRRLLQRSVGDVPPSRIACLGGFAFDPRLRRRDGEAATDFWARRNAAYCERVVEAGFSDANAVYAFNGAALEIFQAAKARGLRTILDQTAAPWRWNAALLKAEAERWPGWEALPEELDASGRLSAREEAEWELADAIVLGSDFARSALAESGGPGERAAIVNYPLPDMHTGDRTAKPLPIAFSRARKLRVVFVGTLQLRKGIQYLHEAAQILRDEPIEYQAVGPSSLSPEAAALLGERMTLAGSVPRAQVARFFDWADVLVLPTLSEGSANVCHEAAAAGVPVITTPNAGAPLRDGSSGLVVPARSAEAIAAALLHLVREPALLRAMAAAAPPRQEGHTSGSYASRLAGVVQRACALTQSGCSA